MGSFVWVDLDLTDAGARVRHFNDRRFFEIGRALHRIYKIRNKIRPPLIDTLHVAPFFIHGLIEGDEAIVTAPEKEADDEGEEQHDHQHPAATDGKLVHKIDNVIRGHRSGNRRISQCDER